MKKYKIIKVIEYDDSYYVLQIKNFGFWKTIIDIAFDDIGLYQKEKRFNTIDEARTFYLKHFTKPKRIMVDNNYS